MVPLASVPLFQGQGETHYRALQEQHWKASEEAPVLRFTALQEPADPLFERLTSLEQSCQSIVQALEKQNATVQAEINAMQTDPRHLPLCSWMQSWVESAQTKEQRFRQRAAFLTRQLQEYPKRYQAYQRITPALIQQVTDIKQLLGTRKFNRLGPLINTYEQTEDADVKNGYFPLLEACEKVCEASSQIVQAVGHLSKNTRHLHQLLNESFREPQLRDPILQAHVFQYYVPSPGSSFSSNHYRSLQRALSRANLPEAPEESPFLIAIPPDIGAQIQGRFESLMDRLLEQQKQIAREWILTEEPEKKQGCGWITMVMTKRGLKFLESKESRPLIGRVGRREPA